MGKESLREVLDEFRSANCVDTNDTIAEIKERLLSVEEVEGIIRDSSLADYNGIDGITLEMEKLARAIMDAQAKKMEGK